MLLVSVLFVRVVLHGFLTASCTLLGSAYLPLGRSDAVRPKRAAPDEGLTSPHLKGCAGRRETHIPKSISLCRSPEGRARGRTGEPGMPQQRRDRATLRAAPPIPPQGRPGHAGGRTRLHAPATNKAAGHLQGRIFASRGRKTSKNPEVVERRRNCPNGDSSPSRPRFASRAAWRRKGGWPGLFGSGHPSLHASISRVLFRLPGGDHFSGPSVARGLERATRFTARGQRVPDWVGRKLLALARGGVCRAPLVTQRAVRSYRTVSPLPTAEAAGGLFSVALSLAPQRAGGRYPPPCPVVLGLSSRGGRPAPSGRLDAREV